MLASACRLCRFLAIVTTAKGAPAEFVSYRTVFCLKAAVDFDGVPLLCVANVIEGHVVVLAPEKWHSIKTFAAAQHIPRKLLPGLGGVGNNRSARCRTRPPECGSGQRAMSPAA